MLRIGTDNSHNSLAMHNLAIITYLFDRCSDLHTHLYLLPRRIEAQDQLLLSHFSLFVPVDYATACQVVGRKLDKHFISRQYLDEVLTHLA